MNKIILTLFFISLSVLADPPRKQNAGLPEAFESHRIPQPERKLEKSAFLRVHLQAGEKSLLNPDYQKVIYETDVPVDEVAPLHISFATPLDKVLMITLRTPTGHFVPLHKYLLKEKISVGDSGASVPVNTYVINDITEIGFYHLKIESAHFLSRDTRNKILSSPTPNAFLIIMNEDNVDIETAATSYMLKVGNNIGLQAQILLDKLSGADNVVVSKADMIVQNPNGNEVDIPMHDDGLLGDFKAGDHIYTAETKVDESGVYHFYAVLKGYLVDEKGNQKPFLKTAEHTFTVSGPNMNLNGDSWLTKVDNERVNINLGVKLDDGVRSTTDLGKFRAYSEVYGVAADGTIKPASWIGSIVNVNSDSSVTLEFNLNWLSLAGVKGPLTLKNTYIADANTNFPITRFDNGIVVRNSDAVHLNNLGVPLTITDEMRFGVNPFKNRQINVTAGPTLMLIHGYCSDTNPFQKNSGQFSDSSFFLDKNANIGHDAFALKVDNHANTIGSTKYSAIGHSQGGMVALHLLNHYWSGLDHASNGRLVQSVGTPWLGNSAAGVASLGSAFGVGCGSNNDLTTDGAKVWFSGINEANTKYVYYYSTTYKQGTLFGDYCSMAINAILQWPNDGVTELKYATLKGATNCGNKEQWCHTTDMKYQAQYYDNTRNAEMNAKAAR